MSDLLLTDEMIETGERVDAPRDILETAPRKRRKRAIPVFGAAFCRLGSGPRAVGLRL